MRLPPWFGAPEGLLPTIPQGYARPLPTQGRSEQHRTQRNLSTFAFQTLVALWLMGLIYPPVAEVEWREALQLASALWLVIMSAIAGGMAFLYGPVFRQEPSIFLSFAALFGVLAASSILSEDPWRSLNYTLISAVVLMSCGGLWHFLGGSLIRAAQVFSILGSVITGTLYWNASDHLQGGRLSFHGGHPNHLGLVAFGILVAALAHRNAYVRWGLVSLNLLVIVSAQARGSFFAALTAIVVRLAIAFSLEKRTRARKVYFSACLTFSGMALVAFGGDWIYSLLNELLLLDDRYRGLGTGFTGRLDAWQEAYELFLLNPLFGVGFRMHELYMTTLPSAHNGYLSMLAETGILGSAAALALLGFAGIRVMRLALGGNPTAILAASFLAGYCVIAFFERFFINVGNPTSVMLWLLLFVPNEKQQLHYARSPHDPILHSAV